ncbi:hypothetical protein VNO78_03658 [Psophocarpus tetragonolobus]|uniref:Uncharacterized protein n=1 Tax=Psophocarpus tetragonolobus TaxID=3891 RepID=A0AAN9T1W2_PSOTE
MDEDDLYENIEAPKFVDLTAPDSRRPDDDRHWFCFRAGCDQKHDQELDSEAVYNNFVLRVMAARSPNVRLRKALHKSANLKCPLTAPAKSRVSRMDSLSRVATTPNAKVKQSPSLVKALTTPRNHQKKVPNVEQFRSVQSKKALAVGDPKSRVVAKALAFNSPKKVLKIKSSIELKTPMRALCSAMKKLELNGVKKNGGGSNSLSVAASKKQLRGREVKSRVFDTLYSNNHKEQETNSKACIRKLKKGMQKRQIDVPNENDSSDMEIDEKSTCGSLEKGPESGTSGSGGELSHRDEKPKEPTRKEKLVGVLTDASRDDTTTPPSSNNDENKTTERSENDERRNSISGKGKVSETKKRKAEENLLASDDKENVRQFTENDEKENASAPCENIEISISDDVPKKKAILGSKLEDSRKTQKKPISTSTASQVVKYRKLKPTNPKPFKLRTDERGILKEANLDRKISSPLKETIVKGGGKAMRKYLTVNQKSETCSTKSEQDTSCDEKTTSENQSESIQIDNTNCKGQRKLSDTFHRNPPVPKLQKRIDVDTNFKRKSEIMQRKVLRPRSALTRKKEKVVVATKLSVIIEKPSNTLKPKEAKPRKNNTASAPTRKTSASSTHRPFPRERRDLTIPQEPKFHSLHVPKGCTTRKHT